MKEIKDIIAAYDLWQKEDVQLALATVIDVEQSSYRRTGARMLVRADGRWTGGISGGCLEGDTLKKAKLAIHTGEAAVITYDTRDGDDSQIGVGLGCNGLIRVLVTPLTDEDKSAMGALYEAAATRASSLLITDTSSGSTTHHNATAYTGALSAVAQDVMHDRKSRLHRIGSQLLFLEYLPPAVQLIIFGGNYDVIPMAQIATAVGWEVTVVTKLSKVSRELQAAATSILTHQQKLPEVDRYSAALLMSHDYNRDLTNLRNIAALPWAYIGLLGPKKRREKLLLELPADVAINQIVLHGPMGLDTGATTPEEIAISVLAEIRTILSQRAGSHLRDRVLPINV